MTDSSRILLVDDEDSCQMMSFLLRLNDQNVRVVSVRTAAEALDLVREENFDLLILDYWLPDATGVNLCNRIREFDQRTPIVFYSGMARESDRRSAAGAGADAYLVKPNDIDRLPEIVDRCRAGRRAGKPTEN